MGRSDYYYFSVILMRSQYVKGNPKIKLYRDGLSFNNQTINN